MQVVNQNIELNLYIFKTFFMLMFSIFLFLKFYLFFPVKQQTAPGEVLGTWK